jgi:NDP-sugar pyrophosphorylase family protein
MAGEGKRFVSAGYTKPKPFIDVAGKPMIIRVLENLYYKDAQYILIPRKGHIERERNTVDMIGQKFRPIFLPLEKLTEGSAHTILYAREYIDNDQPLLIANSDQVIDLNIADFIEDCFKRGLDGSILTFIDPHRDKKWSFARVDSEGLVVEVKEKDPISEYATVGVYLFSKGKYFVSSAIDMFIENDRINGEFYTCPTYNYAIKAGHKIGIYNIAFSQMHGMGTPEDLNIYLEKIKNKECSSLESQA